MTFRSSSALVQATVDTRNSNMTELFSCTPCRGGVPPLLREQAEILLAQAPDWQLPEEAHHIERSFRFRNFREALTFCSRRERPGVKSRKA